MKKETANKIEALQIEVNKMAMLWTEQIQSICETMDYKGSSVFSYNVDRLNQFVHGLNETKVS